MPTQPNHDTWPELFRRAVAGTLLADALFSEI